MLNLPSRVCAVLGPTNTGKTHYAIERMLGHKTGVIGLPLRLLAREVYDKLVALRGPSVVALITGEERVLPTNAQYWVCTVEAMPQGMGTDFVAIDEVQLCADPERGHVFTDRLLHTRGTHETLFLGAETMRGVIARLVPKAEFIRRDRFSKLTYRGQKKISRMPSQTAIVGFSVDNVYAIAELLRRQKGGAAVVMGALSPRTRNAQVEMYQNGDVDYLVATDAIGMGLNLDVKHVAFSSLNKFDGRKMRRLMPNELSQIAGRAGRHTNDGTFGVTGEAPPLEPEVVEAIENHRFMPIKKLQWRNSRLDFGTVSSLLASLGQSANDSILARARDADDHRSLQSLSQIVDVAARATDPTSVRLLWETCQIPDFRQVSNTEHNSIVQRIFEFLHQDGHISHSWLQDRVSRIDKPVGDIDTLSKRLTFMRTWTYVAQRKGWVSDESYWRDETRAVEDRLSDALHGALTQRFVDRRTSVLMRRLKQKESLVAEVKENGEVTVEGQFTGKLIGFRFQLDPIATGEEAKTLRSAALQALTPQFSLLADRCYNAPDTEFDVTEQGGLMWGQFAVGKLVVGPDVLSPIVEPFVDMEAGEDVAEKVRRRLTHFINRKIEAAFEALIGMKNDEVILGLARGVAFRLVESLGVIPRSVISDDVKSLDQDARSLLRKHGVRFGQFTVFQHLMLKPAPTRLRLVLWSLQEGLSEFPEAPPAGLVTIPAVVGAPKGYYPRAGYRRAGQRAIRIDMLERLADILRAVDTRVGFEASADMLSITGMTLDQFADLMGGLGYSVERGEREKVKVVVDATPAVEDKAIAGETAPVEAKKDSLAAGPPEPADTDEIGPEMEVVYNFRWVPKKRPVEQRRNQRPQAKGKRQKLQGNGKPKVQSNEPAPKKDKPFDPDNPFSALMALKDKS